MVEPRRAVIDWVALLSAFPRRTFAALLRFLRVSERLGYVTWGGRPHPPTMESERHGKPGRGCPR